VSFALLEEKTGYSRDFNPGVFKKKVEVKFPGALGGWRAHEMRTAALPAQRSVRLKSHSRHPLLCRLRKHLRLTAPNPRMIRNNWLTVKIIIFFKP